MKKITPKKGMVDQTEKKRRKREREKTKYIKRKILKRDNKRCVFCKQPGDTIDHVLPISKGGSTNKENCVCACHACNKEKGNLLPSKAKQCIDCERIYFKNSDIKHTCTTCAKKTSHYILN